jgi:phosphonoacetaldehyde hydrolase
MAIKAVLFDVIGTTILESQPNLVADLFHNSFRSSGIYVTDEEIQHIRGKEKKEAIGTLLAARKISSGLTSHILESFKENFKSHLTSFVENPDFGDLLEFLRDRNIKVGVGSGLAEETFHMLYTRFHWHRYKFDYIGISEKLSHGRPDPAMIHDMIKTVSVSYDKFLKVGDTPADILEGKNAGVVSAALLSGTIGREMIEKANPDFIIKRLIDLKAILSAI